MASPVRVLLKTALRGQSLGVSPSSPQQALTSADCCYACAGLERPWWLAMRLKWCADWAVTRELVEFLRQEERDLNLCRLATLELGRPGLIKSNAQRARILDMSASWYRKAYQRRYERAFGILGLWCDLGWLHIKRRI